MSEPHDVVKLLVARMESHPEEFESDGEGRWAQWLDELIPFTTEAERVLLRGPMMQDIHERVLDELMNGPDKRRKEKEERESLLKSALAQQQSVQQKLQQYQNAVAQQQARQNAYGQYQNAASGTALLGKSPTSVILDESASIGTITASQPELSLSSSAINQIKKALGL